MTETTKARLPKPDDMPGIFEAIAEGKSLRAACRQAGLHCPSTHTYIANDAGLNEQYARAKEQRADVFAEESLAITKAAALGMAVDGRKVDANGARVYLDAIKWNAARMAPKTAPVTRFSHEFESLTDAELDARLAALEASVAQHADPDAVGEG